MLSVFSRRTSNGSVQKCNSHALNALLDSLMIHVFSIFTQLWHFQLQKQKRSLQQWKRTVLGNEIPQGSGRNDFWAVSMWRPWHWVSVLALLQLCAWTRRGNAFCRGNTDFITVRLLANAMCGCSAQKLSGNLSENRLLLKIHPGSCLKKNSFALPGWTFSTKISFFLFRIAYSREQGQTHVQGQWGTTALQVTTVMPALPLGTWQNNLRLLSSDPFLHRAILWMEFCWKPCVHVEYSPPIESTSFSQQPGLVYGPQEGLTLTLKIRKDASHFRKKTKFEIHNPVQKHTPIAFLRRRCRSRRQNKSVHSGSHILLEKVTKKEPDWKVLASTRHIHELVQKFRRLMVVVF